MKRKLQKILPLLALLLTLCLLWTSCDGLASPPVTEATSGDVQSPVIRDPEASKSETTTPGTTPSTERTDPPRTTISPSTATTAPSTETTAPITVTTAPSTETTAPNVETTAPTTQTTAPTTTEKTPDPDSPGQFDLSLVPAFSGDPFYVVNNHVPFFTKEDLTTDSYELYGALDPLGRCTVAMASLGRDLMPTEDRGSISSVQPTGWHSVMYSNVSGGYLYNRCHLIGWQLTGENANRQNLITGTQFLNIEGMLPFENMLADYIKETNNHVLFRVTPVFEGNNLVCTGVLLEAYSVEDEGEGIQFNVFCYNSQPGIDIDYATGDSKQSEDVQKPDPTPENATYIINTSTKKIHRLDSKYQDNLTVNMEYTTLSMEDLLKLGYTPCKLCNPS